MAWRIAAIAGAALLATGCGSHAALPPLPGASAAAVGESPVADGPVVAWTREKSPSLDPTRLRGVVYVRVRGRVTRVNPAGTYAAAGGIDRGRLVLQVVRGGASRLAVYTIATRKLTYLPRWIDDGSWLWKPDLDGSRLLYGAVLAGTKWPSRYQVRLADLRTGTVRVLADLDTHNPYAAPGQLRGPWATWFTCVENFCNVDRENLETGRVDSPPNPGERTHSQTAPAVDGRGDVYFERTSTLCTGTEVRRWDGVRTTTVLALPAHVAYRSAYVDPVSQRLYFDATRCDSSAGFTVFATRRLTRVSR